MITKERLKKIKAKLLFVLSKISLFRKKPKKKLKKEDVIPIVEKAIEGFIKISEKEVLKKLQQRDPSISDFKKAKKADIEILDEVAKFYITESKIISLLEGAGIGLGGYTLILVDIPSLLTIHLRLICQIALCYGCDIRRIEERGYILKILQLGYTSSSFRDKRRVLKELKIVRGLISKGATWKQLEKMVFVKGVREHVKKLGIQLTKKRLAKLIPILGAILSARINYKLTSDVGKAAYSEYRKRFLLEKRWSVRLYRFLRKLLLRILNAFLRIFRKQATV